MKNNTHNLNLLIKTFNEHSVEFEKQWLKEKNEWVKQFGDKELPKHFTDPCYFNLSEALAFMCELILELKHAK